MKRRSFIAAVLSFLGLRPKPNTASVDLPKQLTFIHPEAVRMITVGKTGRVIWVINSKVMQQVMDISTPDKQP